jgi:hypothetical protein
MMSPRTLPGSRASSDEQDLTSLGLAIVFVQIDFAVSWPVYRIAARSAFAV